MFQLSKSSEVVACLDWQLLLKSPPQTSLAGSALGHTSFAHSMNQITNQSQLFTYAYKE